MDNLNTGLRETADAAEAEGNEAATVPAKFKDVKTLVKAYTELEAEFTKRSRRLKELEAGNKEQAKPDGEKAAPSFADEDDLVNFALKNGRVRDAVIGEYLKSVAENRAVPVLSGGGFAAAPRVMPKSVKEAGRLAREYLNK